MYSLCNWNFNKWDYSKSEKKGYNYILNISELMNLKKLILRK